MSELEFLVMAVTEWKTFAILEIFFAFLLYVAVRKVIVGGVFDPMVLVLVLGYSVNYAVVALLAFHGMVSGYLVAVVFGYGLTFLYVFHRMSRRRGKSMLTGVSRAITLDSVGSSAYAVSLIIYLVISLYILASIGFGIFAKTNRFDAGRGFGAYIRLLDFLSPFIVSYSTLHIVSSKKRRRLKIAALLAFVFYAAMVNGAKISVIFSLFTIFFTLSIAAVRMKIKPIAAVAFLAIGVGFSVLALSINLEKNSVEQDVVTTELAGAGLIVERFVYRVIGAGDTSYLLLPNDVIDKIETDSAWMRFLVPFIGVSGGSRLFGYPVGDYSVGRQALLYYDSSNEVSGGPTSHFDLFAYVYFGIAGGWLFVVLLACIIGSINKSIRIARADATRSLNKFQVAFLTTLWTRAVLVIVEPTVALAYIVDIFIFFTLLSLCIQLAMMGRLKKPGPLRTRQAAST